ncbi:MAG: pyroglutamyl-peptidase I [Christensenellaceae bacterium]|nr:pyroglutamyl-peptidase I [Christensenellaceae bacterium]
MKILVTGFEPFGNEQVNPSWQAVNALPSFVLGAQIAKLELPVVYDTCGELLIGAIERELPDAVLLVGQAMKRNCITPEFVAINQRDGVKDNAGVEYRGCRITPEAPDAYFSTLPVRAMVRRMTENGIPAKLSYTAGTYVCNNLMFHALHYSAMNHPSMPTGFVHIPLSMEQAAAHGGEYPGMEVETCIRGLTVCIETIINELAK